MKKTNVEISHNPKLKNHLQKVDLCSSACWRYSLDQAAINLQAIIENAEPLLNMSEQSPLICNGWEFWGVKSLMGKITLKINKK